MTKSKTETKEERKKRHATAVEQVEWNDGKLKEIITGSIRDFPGGNIETLESAIGCLFLCMYMGRRVMQIVHNPKTIANYEKLLGIKFKDLDFIQNTTELSERSIGYTLANDMQRFWDVVRGTAQVEGRDIVTGIAIPTNTV